MERARGSEEAIRQIIKIGNRIGVEEMVAINKEALAAGGRLSSINSYDDGDWCGNGRIVFPFPLPEPDHFMSFLEYLVRTRINSEILINGLPVPIEIAINVSRSIGR